MDLGAENAGIAFLVDIDAGLGEVGLLVGRVRWKFRLVRVWQRLWLGRGAFVARIENGDVADMTIDVGIEIKPVIVDEPALVRRHVGRAHQALVVALQPVDDAGAALEHATLVLAFAQMLAGGPQRGAALGVIDSAVSIVAVIQRDAALGRAVRWLQADGVFVRLLRPALLLLVPDIAQHVGRLQAWRIRCNRSCRRSRRAAPDKACRRRRTRYR